MKKDDLSLDFFKKYQIKHKNFETDKIITTDINILLNRVRISKKKEFKKRAIFLLLLSLLISSLSIFFFFK